MYIPVVELDDKSLADTLGESLGVPSVGVPSVGVPDCR